MGGNGKLVGNGVREGVEVKAGEAEAVGGRGTVDVGKLCKGVGRESEAVGEEASIGVGRLGGGVKKEATSVLLAMGMIISES